MDGAVRGWLGWPAAMLVIGLVVWTGCRAAPPADVEVEVRNVGFDHNAGVPVVILEAREDGRVLPIWIGSAEAQAIVMQMEKVAPPRPMTHDLVKLILERTGVTLSRVRIIDLRQQTFFATLVLDHSGREIEVDSRPSDAIALALRFACPILVSRKLLDSAAVSEGGQVHDAAARVWGMTVQDLTPVLAESLGVKDANGVLVSDAGAGSAKGEGPRRGDVIVAVDERAVARVADLRAVAGAGPAVRQLEVQRGADRLVIRFDSRTAPHGQPQR